MKKFYITCTLLLSAIFSNAQVMYFQSGYGDTIQDEGRQVILTSDRNYCLLGTSGHNTTDSADITTFIVDSTGGYVYFSRIGNPGDEFAAGIVETSDGSFIIAGTTHASSLDTAHSDIFAMKIDNLGSSIIWSKVFGGSEDDVANSIMKTPDGNFLILGSTKSLGGATESALVLKIDDSGNQQWCNVNNATVTNFFTHGDVTPDGGYVIAGGCNTGSGFDNYVVKMDSTGTILWSKRIASAGDDFINSIITTNDGSFITAGTSQLATFGDTDQCITKIDSFGTIVWAYDYGTASTDRALSVLQNDSGNFVICGYSNADTITNSVHGLVLSEIDTSGTLLWSMLYGDTSFTSVGESVVKGFDGGYTALGTTTAFSDPKGDLFLIKTAMNNSSGCYEYPLNMSSRPFQFNSFDGSAQQLVILSEASDTIMIRPYYDQFSQNCFYDGIQNINTNIHFTVFPNPTSNYLKVHSDFEEATANIYDQLGRLIIHKSISSEAAIDISKLQSGVYIIELKSGNFSERKKIIKE